MSVDVVDVTSSSALDVVELTVIFVSVAPIVGARTELKKVFLVALVVKTIYFPRFCVAGLGAIVCDSAFAGQEAICFLVAAAVPILLFPLVSSSSSSSEVYFDGTEKASQQQTQQKQQTHWKA